MRYGSVCSGIEAATVAWHPLGWQPQWFAEIEPFPSSVLARRWPEVPNLGDFTKIPAAAPGVDLLVGGTPCQSFSVAGLRGGMDDARGQLALEFLRLADRTRARWVVWENVPGVLSSSGGRDFGSFLGGLVELGYGFAYRVLDAQFFGVPQRRRRVFVVGHLGDWRAAAAVLFERSCLRGDPPPSREAREDVAGCLGGGTARQGPRSDIVAHALRAEGFDASEDGTGRGTPLVPVDFTNGIEGGDVSGTIEAAHRGDGAGVRAVVFAGECDHAMPSVALRRHHGSHANAGAPPAIAFHATQDPISGPVTPALSQGSASLAVLAFDECQVTSPENRSQPAPGRECHTLSAENAARARVSSGMSVRRLTPRECERLQGFPDDYTLIPWPPRRSSTKNVRCPDGPRYRALGNSMAVPVMRWIGERIDAVERRRA